MDPRGPPENQDGVRADTCVLSSNSWHTKSQRSTQVDYIVLLTRQCQGSVGRRGLPFFFHFLQYVYTLGEGGGKLNICELDHSGSETFMCTILPGNEEEEEEEILMTFRPGRPISQYNNVHLIKIICLKVNFCV